MAEREELLSQKAEDLCRALTIWARKANILEEGEEIIVSLRISRGEVEDLLDLPVDKFFTHERLQNYGLRHKGSRSMLIQATFTYASTEAYTDPRHGYSVRVRPRIQTLREFIEDCRGKFDRIANIGPKLAKVIEGTIRAASIPL